MARFVTFTPNPALDLSTSVDQLVEAHKMRCDAPEVHPGGGGINVARVLHRLGGDVLAVFPAGGSTGERLHRLVQAEGVPDLKLDIAGDTRESFTAHERQSGHEYRFVLPGPSLRPEEWQAALSCLRQLSPAPAWVISSGSLPPGVPDNGHAQIAKGTASGKALTYRIRSIMDRHTVSELRRRSLRPRQVVPHELVAESVVGSI